VFLTTYICTNNLFLLFDNTTGMTHLKIPEDDLNKMETRWSVFKCFNTNILD